MQTGVLDYLQVFFRRKAFFFYPFIITVFVVVVISFILPKAYVSRAVILIEEEKVINPLISGLAVSTKLAERMIKLRDQILSWKSLVELVKRLKLDKDIKSPLAFENLLKSVRKNIKVELESPQVVIISYEDREPKKVQLVVKTLTDIFIQQNIEFQAQETDVAVEFLKDQLKFYRRKIKEGEIKRLQTELDNFLIDSTEKHPLVKNLKLHIAKLQGELETGEGDLKIISKRPTADKDILSYLILKELKKDSQGGSALDLDTLNGKNSTFTTAPTEGLPLDATVNRSVYEMLLRRLETARITKKLEGFKEGTRFTIIEPPRFPLKPTKPDMIQFLLLGILSGIGVGAGCIYLVEKVDKSYKNITDAKVGLDLPVLGAISTIVTETEFNKKKQSAKFVYTVLGAFFILMVVIVLVFSSIR